MQYFFRTLFSVALLVVISSALLPNRYTIAKTITSHCQPPQFEKWVLDISNWHLWVPFSTYQKTWQTLELANSNKIGAYLKWQSGENIGEMTVTAITKQSMSYSSVIEQHTNIGHIKAEPFAKHLQISWSIEGGINTPIIGSIVTLYYKYKTQDAINLGLRNLNSLCKSQRMDKQNANQANNRATTFSANN
ncbi:hypothetical protein [Pseudoalteromonas sp.]|uniref:hypothetical protein n=1 Tax=Pseudoalteromonas sp. TaxID=53249 RepID=UPI0035631FCF